MNPSIIIGGLVRVVFAAALVWRGYRNLTSRTGHTIDTDIGLVQFGVAFLLLSAAYEMAGL